MKKIKVAFSNQFVKNILILSSGVLAAQAINFMFVPIITRIYGPEQYGILGIFKTIVNVLMPIAALTLPNAIVLPKAKIEAGIILKLSMIISIFVSLTLFVMTYIFSNEIIKFLKVYKFPYIIYFIPVFIFFTSIYQVIEQWLIRNKNFNAISKVTFFQSISVNFTQVVCGVFYPYAVLLIFSYTISQCTRAILLFKKSISDSKDDLKITLAQKNHYEEYKKVLIKYKDFISFRAPQALINSSSQGIPVFMLGTFFTTSAVGYYSLGKTVLELPSQLLAKSVGDVFFPKIAQAYHDKEDVYSIVRKATILLSAIGIVPFGVIIFFGPDLFSIVFGEKWVVAGEYARWISLWSYFGFINRPSMKTIAVIGAQKFHLIYEVSSLLIRVLTFYFSFYIWKSDLISISLFSISGAILNIYLVCHVLLKSKKLEVKNVHNKENHYLI